MNKQWSFKVVLALDGVVDLSGTLKRLVLFCDEIRLLMPKMPVVELSVLEDPSRVRVDQDGNMHLMDENFDSAIKYMNFTMPIVLRNCEPEERDTLQALLEESIVSEFHEREIPEKHQKYLKELRRLLVSHDVIDPKFNAISETKPEDSGIGHLGPVIRLKPAEEEKGVHDEIQFRLLKISNALRDSYDLTTSLIVSDISGFQPVFPEPRHRRELDHKYSEYRKGVEVLRELVGNQIEIAPSGWKFGETAYLLSNALFSSSVIANKPVEDVIRYRNAMREARDKFVSITLSELTYMIEQNPWGQSTNDEIRKFVQSALQPRLAKYQDESKEIWEKLFGGLTVNLTNLLRSMTISSAGLGLLGSVIPGTTTLLMLVLGALAGASKEAPKIVENLVALALDLRKHRRNSIAYIAQFR